MCRKYLYNDFHQCIRTEVIRGREEEAERILQENRYDGEGLRFALIENGKRTDFITNGWENLSELDENGKVTKRIIRGMGIVASEDAEVSSNVTEATGNIIDATVAFTGTAYHYYHGNERMDVEYITDEAGQVVNGYTYDAIGTIVTSSEKLQNRYTYNGEAFDQTTEQYYLRKRFYNPKLSRFLQEDEYRGDGLNLYAFCANNPVMYVDPSGYVSDKCNPGGKKEESDKSSPNSSTDESGRYSVGDATFMDANDAFVSNISRRTDVDANGYFDVIAHGTPNGIQITHNGKHMIVDHRTAARLIQNSAGYNGQAIRLLSCNTGALDNGFAQNLANKLNVEVYAPTNYLWSTPNGNYFVAGMNNSRLPDMNDVGTFKLFSPGGN